MSRPSQQNRFLPGNISHFLVSVVTLAMPDGSFELRDSNKCHETSGQRRFVIVPPGETIARSDRSVNRKNKRKNEPHRNSVARTNVIIVTVLLWSTENFIKHLKVNEKKKHQVTHNLQSIDYELRDFENHCGHWWRMRANVRFSPFRHRDDVFHTLSYRCLPILFTGIVARIFFLKKSPY